MKNTPVWITSMLNRWSSGTVLIVSKDLALKPVFARTLYGLNPQLSLHWSSDCEDAVHWINKEKTHLIICDTDLYEGSNGYELWEHVKRHHPSIPFLMISDLKDEALHNLQENGFYNEAPETLSKPIMVPQCQRKIRDLLRELGRPQL